MSRFIVTAGLSLMLLGTVVQAGGSSPTDELLEQLSAIGHLQGQFDQRQYGEDDVLLGESSGVFRLLRPAYFSWEIRAPDNQLIVANTDYIWHYDIDLQTVTRRPVAGNLQASPLQVLAGDEAVLREQFAVEQDGANRFTLVPIAGDHGFNRLSVNFDGDTITGMDILDKLNQRVVVMFTQLDADTILTAADFTFTPPPGEVDLFYYDE